ncbi:MAG TPA: GGDEF domain-containing protein, partial [Planctomycetota bacterium]|nr:GGDEF domain-containing protein [Planctomycetota bacterium]
FKRINDSFGHPVGDRVLRDLSAHLRSSLRVGDVAGRLGGEEIVVAMEGADRRELVARLDTIRETVRIELPIKGGETLRVTFSAGAAWYPDEATSATALLKRADDALYAAKALGRDRVVTSWDLA